MSPTSYDVFNLYSQYDSRLNTTFMLKYYGIFTKKSTRGSQYYYVPKWFESDSTSWRLANSSNHDGTIIVPFANGNSSAIFAPYNEAPVRKFDDPKAQFSQTRVDRNMVLAQLSCAYLVVAKAYHKRGELNTAVARIILVSERAVIPSGNAAQMMISPLSRVNNERARELIDEYKKWFDLTRTDTLVARDKEYNREIQAWFNKGISPFMGQMEKLKLLCLISKNAIDLNHTTVQQNPGY